MASGNPAINKKESSLYLSLFYNKKIIQKRSDLRRDEKKVKKFSRKKNCNKEKCEKNTSAHTLGRKTKVEKMLDHL